MIIIGRDFFFKTVLFWLCFKNRYCLSLSLCVRVCFKKKRKFQESWAVAKKRRRGRDYWKNGPVHSGKIFFQMRLIVFNLWEVNLNIMVLPKKWKFKFLLVKFVSCLFVCADGVVFFSLSTVFFYIWKYRFLDNFRVKKR